MAGSPLSRATRAQFRARRHRKPVTPVIEGLEHRTLLAGGAEFGGLRGDYFHVPPGPFPDPSTWQLVLTRLDNGLQPDSSGSGPINFRWFGGSPQGVQSNNFAARWTGRLIPEHSGKYTFSTDTDDGGRLWLDLDDNGTFEDHEKLIDAWFDQPAGQREDSELFFPGGIELVAERHYNLMMEMYENGGDADARVYWSHPNFGDEIIPTRVTLPPPAPPPQGDVTNLAVQALPSGRVYAEWAYNGPETVGEGVQFLVSRAPDNNGSSGQYESVGVVATTRYMDSTAGLDTRYHYMVTPVTFSTPGNPSLPVAVTNVTGPVGTGVSVKFYDEPELNSPTSQSPTLGEPWGAPDTVTEYPKIDSFWGFGPPEGAGGEFGWDQFAVTFSARLKAEFSQTYTFYTEVDDGYRLAIGSRVLFDRLDARQPMRLSPPATMVLEAGQEYDLVFTMVEEGGDAGARLIWESAHIPREAVPTSVLTPLPADDTSPVLLDVGIDAPMSANLADAGGVPIPRHKFHIVLRFSEGVTGLSDTDFTIDTPGLGRLDHSVFDAVYDPQTQSAVITFPALTLFDEKLDDGNYVLNVAESGITDTFGNPLEADASGTTGPAAIPFYVLTGDSQLSAGGTANRNRTVDFGDYQRLALNLGKTNVSASEGDWSRDGVVNNADFEILKTVFAQTMPPAAPPVSGSTPPEPVLVKTRSSRPAPKPVKRAVTSVRSVSASAPATMPPPQSRFGIRRVPGAKDVLAT